jgi:hypothetical protein
MADDAYIDGLMTVIEAAIVEHLQRLRLENIILTREDVDEALDRAKGCYDPEETNDNTEPDETM